MGKIRGLDNLLTAQQKLALSSIVQVGESTYQEMIEDKNTLFSHHYCRDLKGRTRTKLVQIQCELESHNSEFPFHFQNISFSHGQIVPQLSTNNMVMHLCRTLHKDALPYKAKYKVLLSNNNDPIYTQLVFNECFTPPYADEPLYGILAFGGKDALEYINLHFPAKGFAGIYDTIEIPIINLQVSDKEDFQRKKTGLRKEILDIMDTGENIL